MSQDPKVVSIKPNLAARTAAGGSLLPAPLLTVRDLTSAYLQRGLVEVFDMADDALFEMADKAANNAEQTLFFEAMRSVRLQRLSVIRHTCDALVLSAEQLSSEAGAQGPAAVSFELDSLTLVQPEELEQSVALDGMVSRVAGRNQTALAHLAMRVNSLARKRVDERNCPFAPSGLVEHFAEALETLELNIKVRLIVFKLFERCVLNGIDTLYEGLNEALISAGVMPDLRLSAVSSSRRPMPARGTGDGRGDSTADAPRGTASEQQEVLGMFSELIGKWRLASGDMALSGLAGSGAGSVPMHSNELLQVLSAVSPESFAAESGGAGLRQQIQQLLHQQREMGADRKTVARVDDDVISLVSMLFDFILEDRELPSAVKVLITRLQLPVLRVAIVDKSFFSRSSHPARRLLNELSRATMGWNEHDDLRRDQLHALLEEIVEQLLAESEPDAGLFDTLYQRLTDFLRTEQRRADRVEQRTRDAEEGRARIQAARAQVAREINGLLVGRTLPVTLVDMLRDTWSQVMQMVFLREGADSIAWQQALEAAMAMVVSVEPVSYAGRELRIEHNRQTEAALSEGLELLGLDAAAVAAQLKALQQPQQAALALAVEPAAPTESEHGAELVEAVAEEPAPAPALAIPEPAPVAVEAVHIEQPVIQQEELEAPVETVEDLPSVGAQRWIDSLGTGCWFQLESAEGKASQRCKLAAIISFSGKFIFVNRNGLKVAEFGRQELARCFDQGRISLLDENQLFDRALESVIGNLRQLQSKS
ncbi:DUF1631 domain-containing protein [Halopseudomonas pachastrellae]|uniref:DUF1631 domain-containing protein n=1 Tax=Halopseudomonas pachastrellae TaxID=254161 RepID=UPI003D7D9EEB